VHGLKPGLQQETGAAKQMLDVDLDLDLPVARRRPREPYGRHPEPHLAHDGTTKKIG
jgi:hypothetical protein